MAIINEFGETPGQYPDAAVDRPARPQFCRFCGLTRLVAELMYGANCWTVVRVDGRAYVICSYCKATMLGALERRQA